MTKLLTQAVSYKARRSRNTLVAQELIKIYQMLLIKNEKFVTPSRKFF